MLLVLADCLQVLWPFKFISLIISQANMIGGKTRVSRVTHLITHKLNNLACLTWLDQRLNQVTGVWWLNGTIDHSTMGSTVCYLLELPQQGMGKNTTPVFKVTLVCNHNICTHDVVWQPSLNHPHPSTSWISKGKTALPKASTT